MAIVFAPHLPGLDVETGQQGAELPEGLKAVGRDEVVENVGELAFEVAAAVVGTAQVGFGQLLPLVGDAFQSVFFLQRPAGPHRAAPLVAVVDLLAPLVHRRRNDMDVATSGVLVQIDRIGLVPVTHLLHVVPGQRGEFRIGKAVFGRGVERDVKDRLLGISVRREVVLEGHERPLHGMSGIEGDVGGNTVTADQAGRSGGDFLLVVDHGAIKRSSAADLGHHRLRLFRFGIAGRMLRREVVRYSPGEQLGDRRGSGAKVFQFVFTRQGDDPFAQNDELEGRLFQFPEQCNSTPGVEIGLDGFDSLVVVITYGLELAVEISQPDVVVHRRLVDPDDTHFPSEEHRLDEFRPGRKS